MKERGVCVYAAHLEGKQSYDEADYRGPCAFLIGNEGNGLRPQIARMADTYIRIPMAGHGRTGGVFERRHCRDGADV